MLALQSEAPVFNRRVNTRFPYTETFTVGFGGQALRVDAYNISMTGVSGEVRGLGTLVEGKPVEVYLQNHRPINGRVRWASGREVGIAFSEDLANHPRIRALVLRMKNGEQAAL